MTLSSVDLPAPFGPMMQTISPAPTREVDALEDLVGRAVAGDDAGSAVSSAISRPPPAPAHIGLLHARIVRPPRRSVPSARWRPSAITMTWSQSRAIMSMWCSISRMVQAVRGERAQVLADLARQRRVDAGDRLVEQDQLRLGHQRAADLEQLLLAAREVGRRIVDHAASG